jgi:AcrR family transcriptional regulator
MTKPYLSADQRRDQVLEAAFYRSIQEPYYELTRDEISAFAGVSASLINKCFGTVENLRQEIIKLGIERKQLRIIADAIGRREPLVKNLPKELKQQAIASMV